MGTKEFVHSRPVTNAVNSSRLNVDLRNLIQDEFIGEANVAVGVATVNSRTMENTLCA